MSFKKDHFTLSDNTTIPAIGYGLGTKWYKQGVDKIDENVVFHLKQAIDAGLTHIDGAEVYNTNRECGLALKKVDVPREKLYITNKFIPKNTKDDSSSPLKDPYDALKEDLKQFGVDYVNLYLIHCPFIEKERNGYTLVEAWNRLEKALDDGLTKSIGVSNFRVEDIEEILQSKPKYTPVVNQIEFNAYLQNQTPGIVDYCKKHNILVEAYSPLGPVTKGRPGPLDDTLVELSKKYNKTESQILLRWVLQQGILPITTSSNKERLVQSLEIFNFDLSKEDVDTISRLGTQKHLRQYWTNEYSKYD